MRLAPPAVSIALAIQLATLDAGGQQVLRGDAVGETARVSSRPSVVIGRADGPAAHTLVNPIDAAILSDGTIVIGDFIRGFFSLRYFDPGGEPIAQAGRYGQGPFEFQQGISFVQRVPGDSVLLGNDLYRYSLFGPRGEQGRSGRWEPTPGAVPLGLLSVPNRVISVRESTCRGRRTTTGGRCSVGTGGR